MKDFAGFSILVAIGALCCGWILNIVALIQSAGGEIGAMFILRLAGVFVAPVGGVLGWLL